MQKTSDEIRISDLSSDVCSSDLQHEAAQGSDDAPHRQRRAAWPGMAGPRPQRRLERSSRVPYRRRLPAHLHDRGKSGELRARRHAFGTVRIACRFLANTRKASEALLFRSEEHTSALQSLMRISYAVFCLKKKKK